MDDHGNKVSARDGATSLPAGLMLVDNYGWGILEEVSNMPSRCSWCAKYQVFHGHIQIRPVRDSMGLWAVCQCGHRERLSY